MTHNWKIEKQKFFLFPDTENTDHGPDMGFYGPLVNQSE
jgi:hypothetical protein